MRYLLFILICFNTFSQESALPWHGLTQIKIENKSFNLLNFNDLSKLDRAIISLSSEGISFSKALNRKGFLSFSVELIANDNLIRESRLNTYNLSLFKLGSVGDKDSFLSYMSVSLLNWDKENFLETSSQPMMVTRFKPIEVAYVGVKKIGKIIKLKISGKISFVQSVVSGELPMSLKDEISKYTDEEIEFGSFNEDSKFKVFGSSLSGHRNVDVSRALRKSFKNKEGQFGAIASSLQIFLGDASTNLGVELFNFLNFDARFSLDSSIAQDRFSTKFLSMNSVQEHYEIGLNLGNLLKKSNKFSGFGVYIYRSKENINIRQESFNKQGELGDEAIEDFNIDYSPIIHGVGVRWNFGGKKYNNIFKPIL